MRGRTAEGVSRQKVSQADAIRLRRISVMTCFLETLRGGNPNEGAEVSFISEDGLIDLKVATHSNGQGLETYPTPISRCRCARPALWSVFD